jgi:hypothetical protein
VNKRKELMKCCCQNATKQNLEKIVFGTRKKKMGRLYVSNQRTTKRMGEIREPVALGLVLSSHI